MADVGIVMRRRATTSPEVPHPHVVDFLLQIYPSVDELAARGLDDATYDCFYAFEAEGMSAEEFLALWSRFESFVRAEAQRRDVPLPDPHTFGLDRYWVKWAR
jgi:hypothetical protein